MNRRVFFATLTAGLAAAADPERLLWLPGRKLISIPALLPPCPFRITWHEPSDAAQAAVLDRLLQSRWRSDLDFQRVFREASDPQAIAGSALSDVQLGRGFLAPLYVDP